MPGFERGTTRLRRQYIIPLSHRSGRQLNRYHFRNMMVKNSKTSINIIRKTNIAYYFI